MSYVFREQYYYLRTKDPILRGSSEDPMLGICARTLVFTLLSTLTYKSHMILISLTVGTPRSRASADDFRALCPAVCCYQTLIKQIQCELGLKIIKTVNKDKIVFELCLL